MPENSEPPSLTVDEVAQRLGVSVEAVLRWIATGALWAIDFSSTSEQPRWRISESALAKFIERREKADEP